MLIHHSKLGIFEGSLEFSTLVDALPTMRLYGKKYYTTEQE